MPTEKPGGIEYAAQSEEIAQIPQARTLLLRRPRLIDGERDPADVDDTPNGKDVSGGDEVDFEAIRYLASVLSVERQGAGKDVDR